MVATLHSVDLIPSVTKTNTVSVYQDISLRMVLLFTVGVSMVRYPFLWHTSETCNFSGREAGGEGGPLFKGSQNVFSYMYFRCLIAVIQDECSCV